MIIIVINTISAPPPGIPDNSAMFPKETDMRLNCFIPHYICLLNIICGILYSGIFRPIGELGSWEVRKLGSWEVCGFLPFKDFVIEYGVNPVRKFLCI